MGSIYRGKVEALRERFSAWRESQRESMRRKKARMDELKRKERMSYEKGFEREKLKLARKRGRMSARGSGLSIGGFNIGLRSPSKQSRVRRRAPKRRAKLRARLEPRKKKPQYLGLRLPDGRIV